MLFTRILAIIDFRTTSGVLTRNPEERLTETLGRLLKDYLLIIFGLPLLVAISFFFYSPLAFWPLLVELLLNLNPKSIIIGYVILLFIAELTLNFKFTKGLFGTIFFLFAFPLLKRAKRRKELAIELSNLMYGFVRLSVKALFVLIGASLLTTIGIINASHQ
jgi:hypothetical protein